jgi:hypothetical protein
LKYLDSRDKHCRTVTCGLQVDVSVSEENFASVFSWLPTGLHWAVKQKIAMDIFIALRVSKLILLLPLIKSYWKLTLSKALFLSFFLLVLLLLPLLLLLLPLPTSITTNKNNIISLVCIINILADLLFEVAPPGTPRSDVSMLRTLPSGSSSAFVRTLRESEINRRCARNILADVDFTGS